MEEARSAKKEGEKGMIIILMAIAIVGLIGAGSLAIDIGSALVTKAELQNVADAASLASTRELALLYKQKMTSDPDFSYKTYTLSNSELGVIQNKGMQFAIANKAGGINVAVSTDDIDTATYDSSGNVTLTPNNTGVKAMQVTSRRDDTSNGNVQTQLARVLGINQIAITAESTAALQALGSLKSGKGEFPIGLDEDWFTTHNCSSADIVKFYPTEPGSCCGFHTFNSQPASAAKLKNIFEGIQNGTFQSPETIAGQTYYEFTGGTVGSAIVAAETMWNAKKTCIGADCHFRTTVPVYQSSGCENPNQARLIVGFARIDITNVVTMPDKLVEGDVECGIVDNSWGDGGGNDYGTFIETPGVIQ